MYRNASLLAPLVVARVTFYRSVQLQLDSLNVRIHPSSEGGRAGRLTPSTSIRNSLIKKSSWLDISYVRDNCPQKRDDASGFLTTNLELTCMTLEDAQSHFFLSLCVDCWNFPNSSQAVRQPSNPDLSAKPIKSSMKKSNGLAAFVRGGGAPTAPAPSSDAGPAGDDDGTKGKSKYIPSGIVGGKGRGMIMPSGGGICMPSYYPPNSTIIAARDSNSAACSAATGSSSHSGPAGSTASKGPLPGNFSPQWGWYISTTPPTPEKYYAAPHTGKKPTKTSEKKLDNVPETKPAEHPAPVFHHSKPSPVFKKGGVPSATMGWPTVPL